MYLEYYIIIIIATQLSQIATRFTIWVAIFTQKIATQLYKIISDTVIGLAYGIYYYMTNNVIYVIIWYL